MMKAKKATDNILRVYMFNVGQGDHFLLELPNGKFGVIDFFWQANLKLDKPPTLDYLMKVKEKKPDEELVISFILISHPDEDHIKGADDFFQWIKDTKDVRVENLWLFAGKDLRAYLALLKHTYEKLMDELSDREVEELILRAGEIADPLQKVWGFLNVWRKKGNVEEYLRDIRKLPYARGGSIKAYVIAPLGAHIADFNEHSGEDFCRFILEGRKESSADKNLVSSVIRLVFAKHALLFGGDTGIKIWKQCLDQYQAHHAEEWGPCRANFIKASHHGSKHSSSQELWEEVLDPKEAYVGISAGRRYGHPHTQTLKHITDASHTLDTNVKVFISNMWHSFVNLQRDVEQIEDESLDWIWDAGPDVDPRTKDANIDMRSPYALSRGFAEAKLAAYIFEFHSDSRKVVVKKGVRSRV